MNSTHHPNATVIGVTPGGNGMNGVLALSVAVAALGGLLFGFDTAVIAGTTQTLTKYFDLSAETLGVTVSCALWGTVAGGLLAALPAERLGGRDSLRGVGILYVVSALGCAFAHAWWAFLLFRLIGGIAIGGCSVFAPMYIAEIAPAETRGKLVGCFQLSIVAGILVAYASNYGLGLLHLGAAEWRADLGIAAIPSLLFFAALAAIPNSPRWLIRQGRTEEALSALKAIGFAEPPAEATRIRESFQNSSRSPASSILSRAYRRPLFIALAIGFFNQLSGINAILYYLNDIFAQAGFGAVSSRKQAVVVGVANLLFTLVGMALIDRLGRKPLLLAGSVGMAFSLGAAGAIFYTARHQALLLPILVVFIGCFAASQGAVIWVYLSEIFPNEVRSSGQSLASFWLWFLTAVVSGLFPVVARMSGTLVFLIFAGCMMVQFFVVYMLFPETRGRTLEGEARVIV